MSERGLRRKQYGKVVGTAMDKSVRVQVEQMVLDKRFKKYIRRRKNYMAHDEKNECHKGDQVELTECRPISKRKGWRVTKVVEKAIIEE